MTPSSPLVYHDGDWGGAHRCLAGSLSALSLGEGRRELPIKGVCVAFALTALSNDNLRNRAREDSVSVEETERRRNASIPRGAARIPKTWWPSPFSWHR